MSTVVGPGALCWNGLITWYDNWIFQTTKIQRLAGSQVYNSVLWYLPEIDADPAYIKRTIITCFAPARLPTPERSIVDYMRHLDKFEEFYFAEGLREYVKSHGDGSNGGLPVLREVAAHYNVLPDLEQWLVEVNDYSDCE